MSVNPQDIKLERIQALARRMEELRVSKYDGKLPQQGDPGFDEFVGEVSIEALRLGMAGADLVECLDQMNEMLILLREEKGRESSA